MPCNTCRFSGHDTISIYLSLHTDLYKPTSKYLSLHSYLYLNVAHVDSLVEIEIGM